MSISLRVFHPMNFYFSSESLNQTHTHGSDLSLVGNEQAFDATLFVERNTDAMCQTKSKTGSKGKREEEKERERNRRKREGNKQKRARQSDARQSEAKQRTVRQVEFKSVSGLSAARFQLSLSFSLSLSLSPSLPLSRRREIRRSLYFQLQERRR